MMRSFGSIAFMLVLAHSVWGQNPANEIKSERPEKLPAIVELDIVFAEWAEGTEADRKEIGKSLTGEAKEVTDRLAKLKADGKLVSVDQMQLTTVEGRKAALKMGQSRPVVTNVQRSPIGLSNGITYQDVGTIAEFIAHVFENDNVVIELRLESSGQQSGDDLPVLMETNDGKKVTSTMTTRFRVESNIRVASGKTIVAAGTSTKSDRHLVLVTAKIVP